MSESEAPRPSSRQPAKAARNRSSQADTRQPPPGTQGPPDPPGPGRNRRRKPGSILAASALIVALVALVGAGMLGWYWYQLQGRQARIPQLAGRVSELSGEVAALGNGKADIQRVNTLAAQLHDLDRSLEGRLKTLTENLRELASRLAGAQNALRIDQAMALIRMAQVRLNLAADPQGAAQALRLANRILTAANNPALGAVHTTLEREIAALQAVPNVDVTGLYVRIEQLSGSVASLPLAGAAVARPPAPATRKSGFSWSGLGAAFKRAFSSLIVIRHGPVAQPLLPPKQAWFVHQNVKLALASAQLALLQGNARAYQASLERATRWIENWYLTSAPGVKQALATLAALRSVDITPELPNLGGALSQLASIRAHRRSPMPAPNPGTR